MRWEREVLKNFNGVEYWWEGTRVAFWFAAERVCDAQPDGARRRSGNVEREDHAGQVA
jgi:hypothetical protein